MGRISYDEFGLFHENASEHELAYLAPPVVRRQSVSLADGRAVSSLIWAGGPIEFVFVHGGAQNAHTWDTTIMAVGRPAIAIDLPGHGHSDWREDGAYTPISLADDVATVLKELALEARVVVGMSLGGLTAMELAARHPRLVGHLVMVDVTPGVNATKAKEVIDFIDGPQSFPDFEALLERTTQYNPTRSQSSLRRGILHNARQLDDGSWQWRYDRGSRARTADAPAVDVAVEQVHGLSPMWDDFAAIRCPMTLVRGAISPVVDDDDVAECRRRQPATGVEVVDGAGHSVQGDRPLQLAAILSRLIE